MSLPTIEKFRMLHKNDSMENFMSLVKIKPIQCLMFLHDFNEIWIFTTDFFVKVADTKFRENRSGGNRFDTFTRTDMTKLITCFRDCVKEPKGI
jgi:hypothetical protein